MIQLRAMFVVCALLLTAAFGQPFWGETNVAAGGDVPVAVISTSNLQSAAANPSGSVTVPADATFAVLCEANYQGGAVTAATLGTGGGLINFTSGATATSGDSISATTLYANVSTLAGGSETLALTRGAATLGGQAFVIWMKGQNATTPVRDADTVVGGIDGPANATSDSTTTDVVAGCAAVYIADQALPAGYTQLGSTITFNSFDLMAMYRAGAATTTSMNNISTQYPSAMQVVVED